MAVRQKGNKWQVDVTYKGQRAPRVSCDSKIEAEKIEADFRAKLLAGLPADSLVVPAYAAPKAPEKVTLGALLEFTYRDHWVGTKAEASSLRCGEAWCLALGHDFPLDDLSPAVVSDVCDRWAAIDGNAAGTINRKLAGLSKMLGTAEVRGLLEKRFKLPKKKEYEGRLRYFDDDEVESLIAMAKGISQECEALFIAAVETGLRQGELLTLTKRDVDFKRRVLMLGATKGNKRRSVLLTKRAHDVLAKLAEPKMSHENLFSAALSPSNLSRHMRKWKHLRGLPTGDEACFHTFRHTCCSRLVQRRVPINTVQKWMGHATISTTMRYSHLAPDSLDLAREALDGG